MGETDTTIISKWYTVNAAEQESTIRFITNTSQNITVVQWQFIQHIKWYPWEKFASMMNDKIIGARIEQNLANLKKLLEEGE
jgi:thiamine kinase-like enzyme